MKTKFKIIYVLFLMVSTHAMGAKIAADQMANFVRTAREAPVPANVEFAKPPSAYKTAPVSHIEGAEKTAFTLMKVNLKGNTVFTKQELWSFWNPFMFKKVTLAQMEKVAQSITQHYREKGYILAQVIVPAQDIDLHHGQIEFQILEGVLGEIKIEGGEESHRETVRDQLGDMPIGKPYNQLELETRLLNVKKVFGLKIRPVLASSKEKPGTTALTLCIERRTYMDGSLTYNNTGNTYTGVHKMGLNAIGYNLVGRSKTLFSTLRSTRNNVLDFYRVRQTQLLGNQGTRGYVEYITTEGQMRIPLLNKTKYQYVNLMVMHPLIHRRESTWKMLVALDGQNDRREQLGTIEKDDHIRTFRVGNLYNQTREFDFWEVSGTINQGFSRLFGAGQKAPPSRYGAKNDVTYLDVHGFWIHKFTNAFSIFNLIGGQYSLDPLLASEEFAVGGATYLRGYDSTERTGDSGIAGLTEFRYMTNPRVPGLDYLQFYTSFGAASINNHSQKKDSVRHISLGSVALGMRGSLWNRFDFTLQAGKPMGPKGQISQNRKWRYIAMLGLKFNLSREWDQS